MRKLVVILAGVLVLAAGAVQAQDYPAGGDVYQAEHTQGRGGYGMSSGPAARGDFDVERRGYEEGFRRGYERGMADEGAGVDQEGIPGAFRGYEQPLGEEFPEDWYRGGFGGGQMRIPFGGTVRDLPGPDQGQTQMSQEQIRRYQEGFASGYEQGRVEGQEGAVVGRRGMQQDRRMMDQERMDRDRRMMDQDRQAGEGRLMPHQDPDQRGARGILQDDMQRERQFEQQWPGDETRGGFGSGATMIPYGGTVQEPRRFDQQYGPEGQRTQPYGAYGTMQQDRQLDQQRQWDQDRQFDQQRQQQQQWDQDRQLDQQRQWDQDRQFDQQRQQQRQWDQDRQLDQQRQQQTQPYGTMQPGPQFDQQQDRQFGQERNQTYGQNATQPRAGQQTGIGQQQQQQQQQPSGIGQQQAGAQSFTGTVDRAGDMYVLIVNGSAYELDADDEEMVRGMIGQEVSVRGTLEDDTIQVQTINRAGQGQQGGYDTRGQVGSGTAPGGQQPN
jgi:hypothetical protein